MWPAAASPFMTLSPSPSALRRPPRRTLGRLLLLLLCFAGEIVADAAESRRKSYALPAAEAPLALNQFAEQSGEQVIFLLNQVKGVRTNSVNGRFTAREAIERLVADTVLRVVADQQTGAFMIQRVADATPPDRTPDPKEKKSPPKPSPER